MCGRYIANSEDEIIEIREILKQISIRFINHEFGDNALLADIYPTNKVLVIKNKIEITRAKWGIEKWDKKGFIINAKSETYQQSGFFKPFAGNRCIIPAHGYYEWQTLQDKTKAKYVFTSENKHGIFMAGIYKTALESDEFVIITKPAEEKIKFIHDRMPLIVKAEQVEDWLDEKLQIRDIQGQKSGVAWEEVS